MYFVYFLCFVVSLSYIKCLTCPSPKFVMCLSIKNIFIVSFLFSIFSSLFSTALCPVFLYSCLSSTPLFSHRFLSLFYISSARDFYTTFCPVFLYSCLSSTPLFPYRFLSLFYLLCSWLLYNFFSCLSLQLFIFNSLISLQLPFSIFSSYNFSLHLFVVSSSSSFSL